MNQHTNINMLRTEIIESEKTKTDLMKWKLVLIAGVGSTTFGLAQSAILLKFQYLICLLPCVCLYVDLIYFQINLKIISIGSFIRQLKPLDSQKPDISTMILYEKYVEKIRKTQNQNSWSFERWAIQGSSILSSIFVILFGFIVTIFEKCTPSCSPSVDIYDLLKEFFLFFFTGLIGLITTIFISKLFENKKIFIKQMFLNEDELKI